MDYECEFYEELVNDYRPNGLHPVHIDDLFKDGQYQILNKLGSGAFSTVWAALDRHHNKVVSLKICSAKQSGDQSQELATLQCLQEVDSEYPGREFLPLLFDHFYHNGPNGKHLVLVQEVLGPSLSEHRGRLDNNGIGGAIYQRISVQILRAVDCLQSNAIVHGDINSQNVLFCLPSLTDDLRSRLFDDPYKATVYTRDGSELPEGVPRYIVRKIDICRRLSDDEEASLFNIKLVDFSSGFLETSPLETTATTPPITPPEIVFKLPLTKSMDIWMLGCITYFCITGKDLFIVPISEHRAFFTRWHTILGPSSAHWILSALTDALREERWKGLPEAIYFQTTRDKSLEQQLRVDYFSGCDQSNMEDSSFDPPDIDAYLEIVARYIRKMLVVDPTQRATTQTLLLDEFV